MSDAPKLVRRLAAAFLVAVAALALVASADAKPKKTKFVSKRYHYSLLLPGGSGNWLNAHATVNWSGSSTNPISNPAFDHLTDMRTGGGVWLITAKRVPKGTTLKKWTAYTIANLSAKCTLLPWRSNAKLGGAPAHRYDATCEESRWIFLAALHAHRGYFYGCTAGTTKRLATQRVCSAVQRSFHYTSG